MEIKTRKIVEANLNGSTHMGLPTICLRCEDGKVRIAPGWLHEGRPGVTIDLRHFDSIVAFVKKVSGKPGSRRNRSTRRAEG